jgi:hypothetical protein
MGILLQCVAWRADTTTLLVIPARLAIWDGRIDSIESIPGLLKRSQIRALASNMGDGRVVTALFSIITVFLVKTLLFYRVGSVKCFFYASLPMEK